MKIMPIIITFIISVKQFSAQDLFIIDGIYCEKPDYSNDAIDKYSKNNISYKSGTVFIYDYYYIDNSGNKRKFIKAKDFSETNPMNLTAYQNFPDNAIDKVKITVDDKLANYFHPDSSYTQTIIGYDYLNSNGQTEADFIHNEMTGVIDNKKNLWLHPPRSYSFKILELNPFPFYYLDETKNRWTWKLDVGGAHYLDSRWIDAMGEIHINYEYIRAKDEILTTPFGKITCKVVNGTARSEFNNKLMKTHLKSYYNFKYGFVKLEYDNINGTKLVFDLIEISKPQEKAISKDVTANVYQQNCCHEYFNETLSLNGDSTFNYKYSDNSIKEVHYGKWKVVKDTLVLFNYIIRPSPYKTLRGDESIDTLKKDTISISFLNPKTKEPFLPKININGKCLKVWPNEGSSYLIPKQKIKFISVKDGSYTVKNDTSNKFIIYYEPNWAASNEFRVTNISKCLIKGGSLIRLDCDNSLDNTYKLDRK